MSNSLPDISTRADIEIFVNYFYDLLAKNETVSPIFFDRLGQDNWEPHLATIADFWETVLFMNPMYKGNSFHPHQSMNLTKEHFTIWLSLFNESINTLFSGPKAEEAKEKANTMAILFQSKLEYYKANPDAMQ
jgi:hemoglobin